MFLDLEVVFRVFQGFVDVWNEQVLFHTQLLVDVLKSCVQTQNMVNDLLLSDFQLLDLLVEINLQFVD